MWEVIGYTKSIVQREGQQPYTAYDLYVKKPMKQLDSEGCKCRRFWYRAHEINYTPEVGNIIIVEIEVRGKYEILTDIQKVK